MTSISGKLYKNLSNIPYFVNVIDFNKDNFSNKISYQYEGFLSDIKNSTSSLVDRSFDSILRNPDFNILSANGTAPVTPAQGSDYEVISNWFLVNGGGNSYTITPTAYTTIPPFGTGSKYYLNLNIPSLSSGLYLYNLNYSLTDKFYNSSQLSDQDVTFSSIIHNKTDTAQKVRFSAFINGLGTTINGGGIFLQPQAINLISNTIRMPQTRGQPVGSGNYTQFRLNFENNYASTLNADVYYLKAEMSNVSTPLQINHTLEQIICSNLT